MDSELLSRYVIGQVSLSERAEVDGWLVAAPENREELARVKRLVALLEADEARVATRPAPSAATIIGLAAERHRPASGRPRRWLWVGLAAATVIGITFRLVAHRTGDRDFVFAPDEFVTGAREATTVQLGDGSVLRLAPSSRLRVTGSTSERVVTLEGRAFFAVAKMKRHPFQVKTSAGLVTVLGTRFDLQARGDTLSLLVVEGRVALASRTRQATVGAGEVSEIRRGELAPPTKATDVDQRLAWAGNFLVFQGASLVEVGREIEAHYHVRVAIVDSILARRTVNTWLSDRSLSQALAVVCTIADADCVVTDSTVTMRSR